MDKERFQELWQPVADGLFGKQKPAHMQQPTCEVRPVGKIVGDLCQIPEEQWAQYAFSREPLNGRLNDDQRRELMHQAVECGRHYAKELSETYDTRDPRVIAEKLGLYVDYPRIPQNTDRVLFAEFREPNKIHIYTDSIWKAENLMSEPGVREALTDRLDITGLILGHELFHVVEEQNKKTIWTHTYRIRLWSLGFLHNDSSLLVLGEIAAMAFTRALAQIPYSPYVMDAFLVYGYSPMAASALYEEMMELTGHPVTDKRIS